MRIDKKDLIWSYAAQFLSIASGMIILPAVLRFLSAEEVGFNYILLSVGALISLVDFGFTPQFSRNITFVYSGARSLLKEGVDSSSVSIHVGIDYRLLKLVIATARRTYSFLGIGALGLLVTVGTIYVYSVTDAFSIVDYALEIWIIYAFSIFFNIYYGYYNALLLGSGQVLKARKAMVYTQLLKIVLAYVALSSGYGLLGWVIINLVMPFVQRGLSHVFYFTQELKEKIRPYHIKVQEKKALFKILWYNAKRGGLCNMAGFMTHQSTVMLAGAFLTLGEVASFGLMQQLFGVGYGIANTAITTYQPQMSYWFARNEKETMRRKMAWCMQVFYILFILSALAITFLAQPILHLIGSESMLPGMGMMAVFALLRLLDGNYWNLCQVYMMSNRYPFVTADLLTGIGIVVLSYVFTAIIPCGIWGLIIGIGISQLSWNDWYWSRRALQEMQISFFRFLKLGFVELRTTASGFLTDCTRRIHLSK